MSRALGLALGWALDQAVGDPRRCHPVAGFGCAAKALEQRTYAARRAPGVVHVALLVAAAALLGSGAERATRRSPAARTVVTAAATWAVLGGRSLGRESRTIDEQLRRGDVAAARVQVRNLVGRDTSQLGPDDVARACIESLAENTSDAVVAPLLWGAVLGVPGLLGYRAVNTLDAMVGHRNDRYLQFGWAAARLDDVANWVPARVAAALTLAVAGSRERAGQGWAAVRRDAPAHPSPNGVAVEAAFAGVLGLQLGGSNVYAGRAEDRGRLGTGAPAEAGDIRRAARLAHQVSAGSLALAAATAVCLHRLRPRRVPA